MASNTSFYIKINSENSDGTVSIDVYSGEPTSVTIPSKYGTLLPEKLSEIQLGLDRNDMDTTDSDIIEQMALRDEDVALASYYLTPEGSVYRRMTPPQSWNREKDELIKEFYESQAVLRRLIDNGYKELIDCEICDCIYKSINKKYREEELASGRIPCVGEKYGCMETTNGSQYCCRTYCPNEVDNIE